MTLIVDKKYLNKNKIAPTVKHESLKVCLKYVSQGCLLLWKGSDFNFNKFYLIPSKLQSIFHIKDEGLSSSSVFQNLLCNFIYSASLNLVSVELPLKSLATSRNNVSIPSRHDWHIFPSLRDGLVLIVHALKHFLVGWAISVADERVIAYKFLF